MDLSVKKTQLQRDAAATTVSQAVLPEGSRNAFAAVLQKASVSFGGNVSTPFAPNALKARFDRPAQAERPERPAPVERGDNRVRAQDDGDNRPTKRMSKSDDTAQSREDTRATDTAKPQRAKKPEKADSGRADSAAEEPTEVAAKPDAPEATPDEAAAPTQAQTSETGEGVDANAAAAQPQAPQTITELAAKLSLQIMGEGNEQGDVLIGTSSGDALKQSAATAAAAAAAAAAALKQSQAAGASGEALKQTQDTNAGDAELDMTMVGPEAAVSESETGDSMFQLQLQAAARNQQGAAKGVAAASKVAAKASTSKPGNAAHEQAADLAQMIGDGKKMDVKVNVAGNALASLPQSTASLAPAAVLVGSAFQAGEGSGATGNGPATPSQTQASGQGAANPALNPAGLPGVQAAQGPRAEAAAGGQTQSFADALKASAAGAAEGAGAMQTAAQTTSSNEGTPQVNAAQGPGQTQSANQNQAAQQAQAPRPNVPPQQVAEQVKVSIAKAVAEGADEIKIQLKPESLGQIEVKLELAANNQVHAVITADRPETLELLKQDSRGLEKALQDAGLKTDGSSLSFNLRGDQQQAMAREGNANGGGGNGRNGGNERGGNEQAVDQGELARANAQSRAALRGGVDVRI